MRSSWMTSLTTAPPRRTASVLRACPPCEPSPGTACRSRRRTSGRSCRRSPGGKTAADRQLVRLEDGKERIGADLVVQIARTFGVELDELVFTHEVYGRKDSVGQRNPIAALEEERDARLHEALRRYEVTLAPLGFQIGR